jgi:hypothetical protein
MALPPPVFTTSGNLAIIAASGPTAAFGTVSHDRCPVWLFRLSAGTRPVPLKGPNPCNADTEAFVDELWLGRASIGALLYDSPSPHGESFTYLTGPRPAGPLRAHDDGWGWQDSEEPYGYGCAWSIVSGGGVIAAARRPHRLGYDHGLAQDSPACPAGAATTVELSGASTPSLSVPGIWEPLATDGRRILLAERDENGDRTGRLSSQDLAGGGRPAPAVAPALVKSTYRAWLAPEGLVLETRSGVTGPGWSVKQNGAVTVAEGRVLYLNRRTLHVRRIRSGLDRTLLVVPRQATSVDLAAGSFGLAIAVYYEDSEKAALYRLPWRTIDRTLTAG